MKPPAPPAPSPPPPELPADLYFPVVYEELRRLAGRYLRAREGVTLQPTSLVHEAYLRLAGQTRGVWQDRFHFFRVAAQMMRRVLVDHQRHRMAQKRGGHGFRVLLAEGMRATPAREVDFVALDRALDRLASFDPAQAELVELRYFAGLTIEETARALGSSPATVKREWTTARAWLLAELDHGAA
jgi:RNA polymerase sigma-70 factor, ECF subfamily